MQRRTLTLALGALALAAGPAFAQSMLVPMVDKALVEAPIPPERGISATVRVPASADDVWKAWTTPEGLRTFFVPGAKVDLRTGGDYELYFNPFAPAGMRGTDGMQILTMQAPRMLTFTWIAPPSLPAMRKQVTYVTIRLRSLGPKETELKLLHGGWGEGADWDAYYQQSEKTWQNTLKVLLYRFQKGPIDWTEVEAKLKASAPVIAK